MAAPDVSKRAAAAAQVVARAKREGRCSGALHEAAGRSRCCCAINMPCFHPVSTPSRVSLLQGASGVAQGLLDVGRGVAQVR